jgi:hypothetical protein
MGRRYSDINRAARLKLAHDNLQAYRAAPRALPTTADRSRPLQKVVTVIPFALSLDDSVSGIDVHTNAAGYEHLGSLVSGVAGAKVSPAAEGAKASPLKGFRAAQVHTFESTTTSKKQAESRATKTPYWKYTGTGYHCTFGKETKASTVLAIDVYKLVKAALVARQGLATNRVSITPERYRF